MWQSFTGPINTQKFRLDYAEKSLDGIPETFDEVRDQIKATKRVYRTGATGSPVVDDLKFAINRVDVVAHSQGGLLTSWYIADFTETPAGIDRPLQYIDGVAAKDEENRYMRDSNFGTGDIRRFISMGTPYLGSPLANELLEVVNPTTTYNTAMIFAKENTNLFDSGLLEKALFDRNDGMPKPLNSAADLRVNSEVIKKLQHPRTNYPEGRKSIQWHPLVGIATEPLEEEPEQGFLWQWLFKILSVRRLTLTFSFEDFTEIESLGPSVSDLIVPQNSQRLNRGFAKEFNFHIHAAVDFGPWSAETTSERMEGFIGRELLDGPVQFSELRLFSYD